MIPTGFPDKDEIARLSAGMLLEIGAVHFNAREPFTLASGLPSPTYIDCRKLISFPRVRTTLMDFLTVTVMRDAGFEAFDNIAGGETAGIPFGALVAERLAFHRERADRILALMGDESHTLYAITEQMFAHVADAEKFLALSEVLGHLDLLEREHRIVRTAETPVVRWQVVRT